MCFTLPVNSRCSECAQGMHHPTPEAFTSCFALPSSPTRHQHVLTALINPAGKLRHLAFQPHSSGIFGCKDEPCNCKEEKCQEWKHWRPRAWCRMSGISTLARHCRKGSLSHVLLLHPHCGFKRDSFQAGTTHSTNSCPVRKPDVLCEAQLTQSTAGVKLGAAKRFMLHPCKHSYVISSSHANCTHAHRKAAFLVVWVFFKMLCELTKHDSSATLWVKTLIYLI